MHFSFPYAYTGVPFLQFLLSLLFNTRYYFNLLVWSPDSNPFLAERFIVWNLEFWLGLNYVFSFQNSHLAHSYIDDTINLSFMYG
jgi:hypothetical protein